MEKRTNTRRVRKKGQYSKAIVLLFILSTILFTIAILVIFAITGMEPTTLIENWFKVWGVELLAMAGIKIGGTAGDVIRTIKTNNIENSYNDEYLGG